MKFTIFCAVLLFSQFGAARDLGYRYTNGKCVNDKGEQGYNPSHPGQCADFRGVVIQRFSLDDMDLRGSLFDGADMQNTTLRRSDVSGSSFISTNLNGVDFTDANITNVNFTGATMVNIHLPTKIQNVDFSETDLSQVSFSYADLSGSKFHKSKLTGAVFEFANLSGCDLSEASALGANLHDAVLEGADLSQANFSKAYLDGARLKAARGRGVVMNSATLRGADLQKADFKNAIAKGAQFDNAKLDGADFSKSDLRSAALTEVSYNKTDFSGAKYNRRTKLPFTESQASALGMVSSGGGDVLIIWDEAADAEDVVSLVKYLDQEGVEVTLSPKGYTDFDGSDLLDDYSAVLQLFGRVGSDDIKMPDAGESAIVKYVAEGGTYINTAWSGFALSTRGDLSLLSDVILIPYDGYTEGPQSWMPAADQADHPLLEGLTMPLAVSGSFTVANEVRPFDENRSEVILKNESGNPVAAVRAYGQGQVIAFAFATSRLYSSAGMPLTQVPVQQLILNAINLGD
jgi:uncharacterized protein YjbI with pentapeptide repeats